MAMSGFERFTCHVARGTGVGVGLFAAYEVIMSARLQLAVPAVIGMLSLVLSLGLWLLHPAALRVAPAVLVLLAVLLPIGLASPYAAMDASNAARAPGYLGWSIGLGFGLSAACVTLAHLIGLARMAILRSHKSIDLGRR